MRLLLTIFFALALAHVVSAEQKIDIHSKVDVALTKLADATGNGQADQITLRILGQDFTHPFKWALKIQSNGKAIYEHESDDAWLDQFFNDSDYVLDCSGYVDCKKKYYFKDLLGSLLVESTLEANPHALDKENVSSIHTIARNFLRDECSVSDEAATEIIQRMVSQIKAGKTPLLYVPISPVHSEIPHMYVEQVNRFVPVYQW